MGPPEEEDRGRTPAPTRANYLALPSRDLGFLKNTLRLYLREDKVAEVMVAFGARCGAGQVVQSQVEVKDANELAEVIPAICAQIGLAKIRAREHGPDHLTLELSRVAEAPARIPRETRMEFTRGFLVGAVSELIDRRVVGKFLPDGDGSDRALVELRWNVSPASGESVPPPLAPVPPAARSREEGAKAPKGKTPAGAFLVEEGPKTDALALFIGEAQRRGGLAITSDKGKTLRARRDLSHIRVYDLTPGESLGLLSLEAGNLPAMLNTVDEFVKRVPGGVVLLTDVPLLLEANGVEPTRNFLSIVAEMLAEGKGELLVSMSQGSVSSGDRSLLLRTLKPYSKLD